MHAEEQSVQSKEYIKFPDDTEETWSDFGKLKKLFKIILLEREMDKY